MKQPPTFRTVQDLATAAGLVMSREAETWRIRLRPRGRHSGPVWSLATLAEVLDVIDRQASRKQSKAA